MRKILFAWISTTAVAGLLHAQGGIPRMSVIFTALDSDHDGTLSADEIAGAPASLRSLDKNRDGKLTADEVRPIPAARGGGDGGRGGGESPGLKVDDLVKSLMAMDQNGDGKLQKSEVPERMQGLFERGDLNKDGVLTADEIRTLAEAQAAAAASSNGPGEGRGGPQMNAMRLDPILNALDQDHDGVISAEEIAGAAAALKALDKNQDGKITQDEVRPNFGPGRGRGGQGQ